MSDVEEKATGRSGPGEAQAWPEVPRVLPDGSLEILVDEPAEFAEYVDAAEQVARDTYDNIVSHLEALRAERELLNEQIALLVEKEAIWKPIINRLDTGVRHRTAK